MTISQSFTRLSMDSSLVTSMVLQETRELPLAIASALEIVRVATIYPYMVRRFM